LASEPLRHHDDDQPGVTILHIFQVALVVAIGATLQGSIGFGLGVFSVPFLLLINPALVPGPLLLTSLVLTLQMAYRDRHSVVFGDLKWAIGGRLVGIAAAAYVLVIVPSDRLSALLGALVVFAVGMTASGLHVRPNPWTLVGAGSLSGFMATTVSVGGPAIALLYQRETGARLRGTLSAYFVVGIVLSLIALHFVGRFGPAEIRLSLTLIPGALVGFGISRRVAPHVDRGYTRRAVLAVSALMGVIIIARYFW